MAIPEDVVRDRIQQRHDHARHLFSTIVSWFTFFVGVNYVAMGWFASESAKGSGIAPSPAKAKLLLMLAVLFATQIALGVVAELVMLKYLKQTRARVRDYEELRVPADGGELRADSCLPGFVYQRGIYLMIGALGSLLVAWVLFTILSGVSLSVHAGS